MLHFKSSWPQLLLQPLLWQPLLHRLHPVLSLRNLTVPCLGPLLPDSENPSTLCLLDPSPTFLPSPSHAFFWFLVPCKYGFSPESTLWLPSWCTHSLHTNLSIHIASIFIFIKLFPRSPTLLLYFRPTLSTAGWRPA